MKAFFFFIALTTSLVVLGQESDSTKQNPNPWGVSLNLLGATYPGGISIDRMVGHRFNVEAGLGFFTSISAGGKYYITNPARKRFNWNVGYAYIYHGVAKDIHYVPIGFTLFTKQNMQFSVDVGPARYRNPLYENIEYRPYAGVKFGYRFGSTRNNSGLISTPDRSDQSQGTTDVKSTALLTPGRIGINLNLAGPTPFLGGSFDVLIANRVMVEAGLGLFSLSGGAKYYVTRPTVGKTSFYVGYEYIHFIVFLSGAYQIHYVPIGLSYFPSRNFQIAIDFGPAYMTDVDYGGSEYHTYGGVKVGYRFGGK